MKSLTMLLLAYPIYLIITGKLPEYLKLLDAPPKVK